MSHSLLTTLDYFSAKMGRKTISFTWFMCAWRKGQHFNASQADKEWRIRSRVLPRKVASEVLRQGDHLTRIYKRNGGWLAGWLGQCRSGDDAAIK